MVQSIVLLDARIRSDKLPKNTIIQTQFLCPVGVGRRVILLNRMKGSSNQTSSLIRVSRTEPKRVKSPRKRTTGCTMPSAWKFKKVFCNRRQFSD
jgi:hypothetical protein